jgi:hypothetical protein
MTLGSRCGLSHIRDGAGQSAQEAAKNLRSEKAILVGRSSIDCYGIDCYSKGRCTLFPTEGTAHLLQFVITGPADALPGLVAGRTCVRVPENGRH